MAVSPSFYFMMHLYREYHLLRKKVTMNKDDLVAWEQKCIQEEPPECTAACPIHIDARLFVKEMGRGDWDAAYKVLSRAMPFPGILGRICDHPCEKKCKRGEVDEPIAIGALERRCVSNAVKKVRIQLLPKKEQRIAVLGAGLAGLTASVELLRKGFNVTLFESTGRLGGSIWEISEDILPRDIMQEELAILEGLKADIRLDTTIDATNFELILAEYDAAYLDLERCADIELPLAKSDDGLYVFDAVTGATSSEKVFAGGGTCRGGEYSPVYETLAGKKGALSIERLIQKSKIDHARENEGPFETRLFTSVAGIARIPRVKAADAAAGFSSDEAREEAARCIQCECMECVKACLYLERYRAYPKKYAREIFNNEHVLHGSSRTKNLFTNSCSTCGLCEMVCPHDFHMGELSIIARRALRDLKVMPPSFHEFALLDLAHSTGDHFFLGRHQENMEKSEWLYFPSCQLCATSPGEVMRSYRHLKTKLTGGVGILLGCCGAPAYWAGDESTFQKAVAKIRNEWERLGKPRFITACSTCEGMFGDHLSEIESISIWEVLEDIGLDDGGAAVDASVTTRTVSIADPCIARKAPETRASVRRIVQSLGMTIEELPLSGEKAECCGYGGLMFNANPELARDLISHRTRQVGQPESSKPFSPPANAAWYRTKLQEDTDTVYYCTAINENDYVAYCAMCRDNLAAGGKRIAHLIELLFPNVDGADPAGRGWISWSERHANRSRVKDSVLRELGEEEGVPVEEYEKIVLHISSDVMRRIDDRRILENDIRKVIDCAERSGKRLRNSETGNYLAYHQPENVTFWVEYSPEGEGFRVYNAYCHRMKIVGIKQ